jgi:hypothetical protein
MDKDIVRIAGQEVAIDHDNLQFNEATLNSYLQRTGPLYSYYTQQMYEAQAQLRLLKSQYDVVYSEKFKKHKQGISDKLAEAHTKTDEDVVAAEKRVIAANRVLDKLKGYLRAWDLTNENALEVNRTMRKEMDKLGLDSRVLPDPDMDAKLEEILNQASSDSQGND